MVSVRDVLDVPHLGVVPVHVADPSIEVRWAATSELADPTPFLEGGELLLTTGLGSGRWAHEWDSYAKRLSDAGVAAVGLGTGLTHPSVPPDLTRACAAYGLNLLEVPRAVTFVSVGRATARLLDEAEREATRTAAERQRSLVAAAARSRDVAGLVADVARMLGGGAALLGRRGEPLAGPHGPDVHMLDLRLAAREVERLRSRVGPVASHVIEQQTHLEVHPVGTAARSERYLALARVGRPDAVHRASVTTAVALLGLAVESEHRQRDTERALRARALDLIVDADPVSARLVLDTLPNQVSFPPRCRVLRAKGAEDDVADALAEAERGCDLAARWEQELVILVADGVPAVATDPVAERVATLVGQGLRVGVGPVVGLGEVGRSFELAGRALGDTAVCVPVVWWERLVERGAEAMLDQPRARQVAHTLLQPLDSTLRETLRCFLTHHGSRVKVAHELRVHRNTVRARVEQIEALLGASLDDAHTRSTAWLALQMVDDPA